MLYEHHKSSVPSMNRFMTALIVSPGKVRRFCGSRNDCIFSRTAPARHETSASWFQVAAGKRSTCAFPAFFLQWCEQGWPSEETGAASHHSSPVGPARSLHSLSAHLPGASGCWARSLCWRLQEEKGLGLLTYFFWTVMGCEQSKQLFEHRKKHAG